MHKEKVLVPELRFSEFEVDWDLFPFEHIVKYVKSGKSKREKNGIYNLYGSTGIIGKTNDFITEGSYLLVARVGANAGQINFVKGKFGVSDNTLIISFKDDIKIGFVKDFLIQFDLNRLVFGSGQPLVTGGLLKKIKVAIPISEEQQKIANFLTSIDNQIQTLEKKKTLLEQYKKGVMQKIFKQELRFKDDEGGEFSNWKLKRIGEVFKERNEKNFTDMELLSVSISKGIYPQSESNKKDNSNSDKSKYKRVLKDDIAYNSMRMWQGASAVSDYDGIVSPAYTILKGNEYQYSIFYGYLFKMSFMIKTFQKHSQGLTSDTWNLKYPMISKIKINIPSLEEQIKIANFLLAIDKNIALVNTKIEQTKSYKKGLLQQMFV